MFTLKWNADFYPMMLFMFIFFVGCSVENLEEDQDLPEKHRDRTIEEAITILDAAKKCASAQECVPLDEDCCGAGKFFVVNKNSILQARGVVRIQCNRELAKNKMVNISDLCKDKTNVPLPEVECASGKCALKGGPSAAPAELTDEQRAECSNDGQCEVIYKDICNTRDEPLAINIRHSTAFRRKIGDERRKKLKESPEFCLNKRPPEGFKKPSVKCVKDADPLSHCKIQ